MARRKIIGEDGRVYVEEKRGGWLKYISLPISILIFLGILGAMFGPEDDNVPEVVEETTQYVVAKETTETPYKVRTETTMRTNNRTDDVPMEYKNALATAESYFKLMNMSKQRIYDQLTSEYGEKFPAEAAQYAVDNLQVDYKEAALKTAKSYAENMNMSKQRIYDQLISDYGEKFTPEEAQYAIDNLD